MYVGFGIGLILTVAAMAWFLVANNEWGRRFLPPGAPGETNLMGFRGRNTPFVAHASACCVGFEPTCQARRLECRYGRQARTGGRYSG